MKALLPQLVRVGSAIAALAARCVPILLALASTACAGGATRAVVGDAHVHLSYRGPAALDALAAHGVDLVRDCGGDAAQLRGWRDEIARGERVGPRIYFSGRVIDGPKPLALFRLTVHDAAEARARLHIRQVLAACGRELCFHKPSLWTHSVAAKFGRVLLLVLGDAAAPPS